MRYDAVIFDLDGTLLDTLQDLAASVDHALAACGAARRSRDEVRSFVGNGVRTLMARAMGEGHPRFEEAFEAFRRHYAEHCRDSTAPYPGIMELVRGLQARGVALGIVSNKSDAEVKKLNERFFGGAFPVAVGEKEGVRRKPAPDSVVQAMQALGADIGRTLYVGDSEVDVQTAKNAGMAMAAVTWGFRSREELAEAGASVFLDRPEELLAML